MTDPAIRYWAAVGLVAQQSLGTKEVDALVKLLGDPMPSCQIAAAKALLTHAPQPETLEVLIDQLHHQQLYVSLLAANALEPLGNVGGPTAEKLRQVIGNCTCLGRFSVYGSTVDQNG